MNNYKVDKETPYSSKDHLYCGIGEDMFKEDNGKLRAKLKRPFSNFLKWDAGLRLDTGLKWDVAPINQAIMHPLDSDKYKSSGISVTPKFDRAQFYATYESEFGYVFKIDKEKLIESQLKFFDITEEVDPLNIKCPSDHEFTIALEQLDYLPEDLVIEITKVKTKIDRTP